MRRLRLIFVQLSEDGVAEELIFSEVEAECESSVVWAVKRDFDVCQVLQNLLIMGLHNPQQSIIIGIPQSVKPELRDALSVLVVALQVHLSHSIHQLLLLLLLIAGPVSLLCGGFMFPTE